MSTARSILHRRGLELLRGGAYLAALNSLENTLREHGSHVGLRSDLAFAAYLAGDMGAFRQFVEALEAEFDLARPRLTEKNRILTHVALAKFLEELGRVADALNHVDEALALLSPGDDFEIQVKAQKLRLFSSFGRESEVAALYQDCLFASERNPDLLIESFHALILAEARLLGFAAALARLKALAKRKELLPSDLRLCAMDLLEISLESECAEDRQAILTLLPLLPGDAPDAFEQELLRICQHRAPVSEEDFLRWSRTVSPMGYLRLLAIEHRRTGQAKRFALQLESLDHRSRQFLQRKWRPYFPSQEIIEMVVDPARRTIRFERNVLTFGAKAQPWDLLKILSASETMCPVQLMDKLGLQGTESEEESLRINLLRLNKRLCALAGVDWALRYRKQAVQRNPLIKLTFI